MVKITLEKKEVSTKKYSIQTVAQAIGVSEGAIAGYFKNKGIQTKGGLTLEQISEVIMARIRGRIRGNAINWADVAEIRVRLIDEFGIRCEQVEGEENA